MQSGLLSNWLIYMAVGKVMIFLWQELPLPKFFGKLHTCDLCAGVWIYGFLSFFMGLSLLEVFGFNYVPVVSELVTGGVISFIIHIFFIGIKERFNNVVVV